MDSLNLLFTLTGFIGGFGVAWLAFSMKKRNPVNADDASWFKSQLAEAQQQRFELSAQLEAARQELSGAREREAGVTARKEALDERLEAQAQEFEKMQKQLKLEFENAATKIFETMSGKFTVQSQEQLGHLLTPLQSRLAEFQKLVGESFGKQGQEQYALKSEIERVANMSEALRLQADSLTKALKGDVKAQGNWGEIVLERILEDSGLRRGVDYIVQAADMGLTNAEGRRQHPDILVKLPDGKHIVIDSKVSLTAYERYCAEAEECNRPLHLKEFVRSVRSHIVGLESKRYQDNATLGTPDYVLMFMPVEGAYSLAIQHDGDLHGYAWNKDIAIVNPMTLFVNLRTIASLWKIETRNQSAEEIGRQGAALYDKFVGFVEDMQSIGKRLDQVGDAYGAAMNKLKTGKGNLITSTEKLKKMGAPAAKSLPKEWMELEENEPPLHLAKSD